MPCRWHMRRGRFEAEQRLSGGPKGSLASCASRPRAMSRSGSWTSSFKPVAVRLRPAPSMEAIMFGSQGGESTDTGVPSDIYVVRHHGAWRTRTDGKHSGDYPSREAAVRTAIASVEGNGQEARILSQGTVCRFHPEWDSVREPDTSSVENARGAERSCLLETPGH
jgi:hypothetical protein